MTNNNFELFMCCLGNGTTICNKAVTVGRDYKYIGHISDFGKIKLYVSDEYIPAEDMQTIQRIAEQDRKEFLTRWNALPIMWKYERVLDSLPTKYFLDMVKNEKTTEEKVTAAEKILYDLY